MSGRPWFVSAAALLAIAWGATAANAATISTLGSNADTYLRDATVRGGLAFMDVRGAAVDFRGYLRFDLSTLGPNILISDASLKLTLTGAGASRNDAIVAARYATYGLNNVAGNTPQNWAEATFVIGQKGTEDVTTLAGVTDLDDNVAGISEILNPVAGSNLGGTTVTLSGAPLVAFLQGRAQDGGLATFILSNDDATDRGFGLATKENLTEAWRPVLTLTYLVPEPTSAVLFVVALAGIGAGLRRRS
jgi:hypothetical protein